MVQGPAVLKLPGSLLESQASDLQNKKLYFKMPRRLIIHESLKSNALRSSVKKTYLTMGTFSD
jgi:hypothetical protein